MSHPFTLGIVGAGNVVSANHLPVLLSMSEVEVSWITDRDSSRARNVAQAYGITNCDLSQGFQNFPRPDAVLLAIPYGVRDPYYSVLAAWRSAVYVEKPFARTVAIHRELCALFSDYELACGLNRRSWGIVRFCRNVIGSQLLGKVRRVRFGLGSVGGITAGSLYLANASVTGGGMLFETGVHGIDTVLYCLDAQTVQLNSGDLIVENGHDIHCRAELSLVDSTGCMVPFEIEVSLLKDTINRVEFQFDGCVAHFSLFGSPELVVESRDGKVRSILADHKRYYPFTWNQVLFEFWKDFFSGVAEREANYTSATKSMLTTEVVEQLYSLSSSNH
jgi:predicted dehydrogenase